MFKGGKDQTRLFFAAKLAEDMLGVNHPAVALTEGCMHPDLLANLMSKTAIKAVSDLALIVGVKEATTATTRGLLRPLLDYVWSQTYCIGSWIQEWSCSNHKSWLYSGL